MGSISTIYNGIRTKLAGRALMDVALSDRSTNGVQNKVIKAKFDEVDDNISQLNSDLAEISWVAYDDDIKITGGTSTVKRAQGIKIGNNVLVKLLLTFTPTSNTVTISIPSNLIGSVVALPMFHGAGTETKFLNLPAYSTGTTKMVNVSRGDFAVGEAYIINTSYLHSATVD